MRFAGATRARYSLDIIKGNGVQEKSGLLSSSIPTILQDIDLEVYRQLRRLRAAVLRAWETIIDVEIKERIRTMH